MRDSRFIEEFQEETRVATQQRSILRVLKFRFGPATVKEFTPLLRPITDSDNLDRLLDLAAQSTTFKQFRDGFAKK